MRNLLTSPSVCPLSSWGLNWESGLGLYAPLYFNFLSLPTLSLSFISNFSTPQDSPTPQHRNLGGGIVEQQDSQRLEDRATHSPSAREEEGPSGAT